MPSAEEAAAKTAANAPNGPTGDSPTESPAQELKGAELESALEKAKVEVPAGATADEKRQLLAESGYDPSAEEAAKVLEEERKQRAENPNTVITREANEKFGGESFGYGG